MMFTACILYMLLLSICLINYTESKHKKTSNVITSSTHGCSSTDGRVCDDAKIGATYYFSKFDTHRSKSDMVDYNKKILMSWSAKAGMNEPELLNNLLLF